MSTCVSIKDYEQLKCRSISDSKLSVLKSWSNVTSFSPIRRDLISNLLVCPYSFSCSSQTCECCDFRACDCAFYCPAQCKCARDYLGTFDQVNCSSSLLGLIPSYFPMSTTEILLNSNSLKRVQPYQFFGRLRLTRIDLSNNNLAFLEENSFNGLANLNTMLLDHNELQFLLGYEFKDLEKLEILHLEHNR